MALLLLTLVRGDLMRNWRASLPSDAPNAFLINVLPDQVDGVRAILKRELAVNAQLSPMVRGRLVAINDKPLDTTRLADEGARRLGEARIQPLVDRYAAARQSGRRREWWRPGEGEGVSLEEGIAQTLGIKLGDTLTYDIVGTRISAKVTNLRKVDWGQLPRQLLRLVLARCNRRHASNLYFRGARRQRKHLADCAAARLSERIGDRRRGDPAAGADNHRAGGRARSSIVVPLYACSAVVLVLEGGNRGNAGRAPPRRRDFCARWVRAGASSPRRRWRNSSHSADCPDLLPPPARRQSVTCSPTVCF